MWRIELLDEKLNIVAANVTGPSPRGAPVNKKHVTDDYDGGAPQGAPCFQQSLPPGARSAHGLQELLYLLPSTPCSCIAHVDADTTSSVGLTRWARRTTTYSSPPPGWRTSRTQSCCKSTCPCQALWACARATSWPVTFATHPCTCLPSAHPTLRARLARWLFTSPAGAARRDGSHKAESRRLWQESMPLCPLPCGPPWRSRELGTGSKVCLFDQRAQLGERAD